MEKNRIEAFTDGVFAIVITLLVLELKLPHTENVAEGLKELQPKILCYIFSFIIAGLYWTAHHSMFHYVKKVDKNLLWLNNIFLMTMGFLPFPTAVFGEHPTDTTAAILYLGTLALANITSSISWAYAGRAGLMAPDMPSRVQKFILKLHMSPVLIYALAAIFITSVPLFSYFLMVFVPAFFILPNPWIDRQFAKLFSVKD